MDTSIPFVDAHHHFWDLGRNRHPWLQDEPPIPFRYGDYRALRRDFLPDNYRTVSRAQNVVASITMEGEWDEDDPVAETEWMGEIAATYATPAAHVARAFLHRADVRDVLAGHAASPLVRGIRHKPAASPSPGRIEKGATGSMSDPAWRRGYAMLAGHGLHFELQAPWWHVDDLLDLISAFPDTPVVINHAFLPADRSGEALAGWRAALKRAAGAPQTTLKISGIGLADRPWSLSDNGPVIRDCIEAFGPQRCMFASNFPVDGLTGSFDTIVGGFRAAVAGLPVGDQKALLHDTAVRVYRLDRAMLGS